MQGIKIIFAGLDSAGKTSFLNTLEEKYSTLINIKPTLGPDRREFNLFGFKVSTWDLGGQVNYRDKYLSEKDKYFIQVDALFYIFDVQDKKRLDLSLNYLRSILDIFKDLDEKPVIICCWHKFDKDISKKPEYLEIIDEYEKKVKDITDGLFSLKTFNTSIFDKWTLLKAFSQGVVGTSPKKEIIDYQLNEFAKKTFSSAVLLLDHNHLLIGSSTNKQDLLEICEAIIPHVSNAADKLSHYEINVEKLIVSLRVGTYYKSITQNKEMVGMFIPIKIADYSFSLFSLTKNPKTLKLMMKFGMKLASNLSDIITSFYF
ncbi:MAG: ADP-ribosylation factor-like protein [Promethearchaeota archaeon]